jgi:hypothetical protein
MEKKRDPTPAAIYGRLRAVMTDELDHAVAPIDVIRCMMMLATNAAIRIFGQDITVRQLETLIAEVRRSEGGFVTAH